MKTHWTEDELKMLFAQVWIDGATWAKSSSVGTAAECYRAMRSLWREKTDEDFDIERAGILHPGRMLDFFREDWSDDGGES